MNSPTHPRCQNRPGIQLLGLHMAAHQLRMHCRLLPLYAGRHGQGQTVDRTQGAPLRTHHGLPEQQPQCPLSHRPGTGEWRGRSSGARPSLAYAWLSGSGAAERAGLLWDQLCVPVVFIQLHPNHILSGGVAKQGAHCSAVPGTVSGSQPAQPPQFGERGDWVVGGGGVCVCQDTQARWGRGGEMKLGNCIQTSQE